MAEIYVMTDTSQQWEQTIRFAESCSWSAGKLKLNHKFIITEKRNCIKGALILQGSFM